MSAQPTRTCVIATTPRSGSWWLAEALQSTGLVGDPQEYFEPVGFKAWCRDFGLGGDVSFDDYVAAALTHATTANGVASLKLHWSQIRSMTRRLREIDRFRDSTRIELVDHFMPDARYVHLVRGDKARQAISYFRALKTQTWWQVEGSPPVVDPEPDFTQIFWLQEMLADHDQLWLDHLAAHGKPVIELTYEDMIEDQLGNVAQVLDLMDVQLPDDFRLPPSRLRLQRDEITEEWLAAYLAVKPRLPPIPRPYRWSPERRRLEAVRRPGQPKHPATGRAPAPKALHNKAQRGGRRSVTIPQPLPWSFLHIVDHHGDDTRFAALRTPLLGDEVKLFRALGNGRRIVGLTSYGPFPRLHPYFDGKEAAASDQPGWTRPNLARLDGWIHCFRDPDADLPPHRPRLLLSESDFTDPDETRRVGLRGSRNPKPKWDVVYVCLNTKFARRCKNWPLGKRCVELLSSLGLRVLLVGGADMSDAPKGRNIDLVGELEYDALMRAVARSRVLLVPNELDASPRLTAEAMCLGVPVVMNRNIVGGWKYVDDETGRFFTDATDVAAAVRACLDARETGQLHPYEWFATNYGPARSGRRLADFLRVVWEADAEARPRTRWPLPRPAARSAYFAEELGP